MPSDQQIANLQLGIADLQAGTARALEVICRQLIERKLIDKSLLLTDLSDAEKELSPLGDYSSVPALLSRMLEPK
jgi:hypothetical protein